jgi:chromosome partitioning protein
VPVDPERFSLSGLKITLNELNSNVAEKFDTSLDISIVLNKFDGRTGLSHATLAALFNDESYQKRLFKTFIRTSQDLPNAVAKNKTIFDSLRSSTAKEDIDLLAREIIERLLIQNNQEENKMGIKRDQIEAIF